MLPAASERRVEFSLSLLLSWGSPTARRSASCVPSSVGWQLEQNLFKTQNQKPAEESATSFFFFWLSLLVLKIILCPVFTVVTPMVESSVWSVTLREVS